jgi:tetratricopeptide (TPR) repeat protein
LILFAAGCVGTRRAILLVALLGAIAGLNIASAVHATIGAPVDNAQMPTADGGTARALHDVEANVLFFFRPDQGRSTVALRQLAKCQQSFATKSVHWTAVVSDTVPAERAAGMVRDSRFEAEVLIDKGDALYRSVGMALHPVLLIVDRNHKLAAFEPFSAVNFCAVVTARLRFALKEISEAQLKDALDPPPSTTGETGKVAQRLRAYAENLLNAGSLDKALENARKSLERDPAPARSHALVGEIHVARGECPLAIPAFEKALAIEPANQAAKHGLERCKTSR